jgi:hypothetical protein
MAWLILTNNPHNLIRPWLQDFPDVENLFDSGNRLKPFERLTPAEDKEYTHWEYLQLNK